MKNFRKTIYALVIFLVTQLIGGLFIMVGSQWMKLPFSTAVGLSLIIANSLAVALLFVLRMVRLKTFSPLRVSWSWLPLLIVAALVGIFSMNLLCEQLNLPDMMAEQFKSLAHNPWGILAMVVVAPITEELLFREAIISSLLRHHNLHRWQAVLISSLAFGIVHFNPVQVVFAFFIGIILGTIFVKTGRALVTSIIHIINNGLAAIEMRLFADKMDELTYSDLLGGTAVVWTCIVVGIILCVALLTIFCKHYHRHRHHNSRKNANSHTMRYSLNKKYDAHF